MKLGTRLIMYLVVTLILVMSAHAIVNIIQANQGFRDEVHRFSKKIAHIVANEVKVHLPQKHNEKLQNLLAVLSQLEGVVDIVIQSPQGTILARVHAPREGKPTEFGAEEIGAIPPEGIGRETRWAGLKAYEYLLPVKLDAGQTVALVRVIMDLTFVAHHNARARWANIATIGFMTALLASLFFFFTRKSVVVPLEELTRAVAAFRRGNWGQRISVSGQDEIGVLANEFNAMAEEIERANRRLILEHEHQRAIVHSLREGVIVLSPSGRVESWNKAALELSGVKENEETAASLENFIEAAGPPLSDSLEEISQGPKDETLLPSFDCKCLGGLIRRLQANIRKLKEGPLAGGTLLVIEDVTEQEALAHQVMRAERLASLGQLVSGIAHEVGTPLNVVNGRVQQALAHLGSAHPVHEKLVPIVGQIDRIAGLVRKLLEFARGSRIQPKALDLNREIREVTDLLEPMRKKTGVELSLDLSEDLPSTHADPGQMQQLVLNLCVNALQAMPDGGRLTISTREDENGIVLSISDTGHGIAPEIIERIFDPFFTTKDIGKGTGLGLSVCHRIVSDHGGRIDAISEPNEGSTFVVRLPALKTEVSHEQPVA